MKREIYKFCMEPGTTRTPGITNMLARHAIPRIAAKFQISELDAAKHYRKWRANYVGA